MRIKIVICVAILLGICSILLGVAFYQTSFLHMESVQSAESRYIRYDGNCVKQLTDEEIAVLKLIFNNKFMMKDIPACPFSDDVSIKFDNELTLWIGYDSCGIVYVEEKDRYIDLSDSERDFVFALLKS